MDRYGSNLPKRYQADYYRALNNQNLLQEGNMSEEDYKLWMGEIELITQRIVDLYDALENRVVVSSDRQRVSGALLHGVKAMNTAKDKLRELRQHRKGVLA